MPTATFRFLLRTDDYANNYPIGWIHVDEDSTEFQALVAKGYPHAGPQGKPAPSYVKSFEEFEQLPGYRRVGDDWPTEVCPECNGLHCGFCDYTGIVYSATDEGPMSELD